MWVLGVSTQTWAFHLFVQFGWVFFFFFLLLENEGFSTPNLSQIPHPHLRRSQTLVFGGGMVPCFVRDLPFTVLFLPYR